MPALFRNFRRLRKCTAHENRPALGAYTPRTNEEDYILSALKSRNNAVEVILVVNFLLIDLENNVTAAKSDVIGKRAWFDVGDDSTIGVVQTQPISHVFGEIPHRDADLALGGLYLAAPLLYLPQASAEEFLP